MQRDDFLASSMEKSAYIDSLLRSFPRHRSPLTPAHERVFAEQYRLAREGFLGMALHHGWRAVGVELSSSLAARAREELRLDVRCGDFLDVPLPAESFDAITMWDFLEHVLDPARVVEKARGLLKPSGYLVIFTIDTASLFNTIAHLMHGLFGQRAQQPLELLYDARHNYYFTQASLAGLLDGRGFRIESTVSYRAYLGRWLAEPASFGVRLVGDAIDLASVVLRRKYRQLVYCRTAL